MSCFGDCIKASAPGNENSLRKFLNKINKTKSLNNSKKQALIEILKNPPANYKKNTLTRIANILKPYAKNNQNISKLLIQYMNTPNNTRRTSNNSRLNPLVNNTRRQPGIAFGPRYNKKKSPIHCIVSKRKGIPPRPLPKDKFEPPLPRVKDKSEPPRPLAKDNSEELTAGQMAELMFEEAGV